MFVLLWGILTLCITIGFIILFFKTAGLVRDKWGLPVAIIFVIGCLSFSGAKNDKPRRNGNQANENFWEFESQDSVRKGATFGQDVLLEKNLVSRHMLTVSYGKGKQDGANIPISASFWINGFVSGTDWRPIVINVERTNDNNRFQYYVTGIREWKVLGIVIYSQPKDYDGFVALK